MKSGCHYGGGHTETHGKENPPVGETEIYRERGSAVIFSSGTPENRHICLHPIHSLHPTQQTALFESPPLGTLDFLCAQLSIQTSFTHGQQFSSHSPHACSTCRCLQGCVCMCLELVQWLLYLFRQVNMHNVCMRVHASSFKSASDRATVESDKMN